MGGETKSEAGKFDLKIKIVRTDLASREYLLGAAGAFGFGGEPAVYQNSSYISKLWFINNYSGGILAKEKVEDMPERYRRFVRFGNPSETEMLKNYQKEMIMQSNREQIGQNVFYSRLSSQTEDPVPKNGEAEKGAREAKRAELIENIENIEGLAAFENFKEYVEGVLYGEAPDDDLGEDDWEQYDDDQEIRDILQLNNVYNSEVFKMSKVEYDFNAPGFIRLTKDGMFDITYDETEMTGIEGSYVRIAFCKNNRDIITFHRKNFFDEWFALEKGKRVAIERVGSDIKMVTAASGSGFVNTINLSGGQLCMVYTTEINGVPAEMVSYSVQAKQAAGKSKKQNKNYREKL
ncbi:MAG: hypothetical protein FWD23_06420 [Oscillospiraceae bacterium]|nr:hypothetical protein [Oscillospiraceae bacterium]